MGFLELFKKIKTSQLTLGMHLHKFCAPWLRHPFLRSNFKLVLLKDIDKIQLANIDAVIIDTSRGTDVLEVIKKPCLSTPKVSEPTGIINVPLEVELKRAVKVYSQSKSAIKSMFADVRMGKALDIDSAKIMVSEISESVMANSTALISIARLKNANEYTYMHSVAVCALMIASAKELGLNQAQCREAGIAGLLHDIGKVSIPNVIINKTGPLTEQEVRLIRTHPEKGYSLLKEQYNVSPGVLDVCLHHHEKIDGSGYPKGLKGDQISTLTKIAAVCDVYDAITSDRPYKAGWKPAEAMKKMAQWEGHFDPRIFQLFVKVIGIYPIGSFVRLQSGKMGVVYQQNSQSLLNPQVNIFFCSKRKAQITFETIDLSDKEVIDKIISVENAKEWGIHDSNKYWAGNLV